MMQVLRLVDTDVLSPYNIQCLGKVLFQLVEYDIFESKWTQLAESAAAQNRMACQDDPRYGVRPDMLLGIGEFADVNMQIAYEPLVLEQYQKNDMAALVQTMEMSAPKQLFAMIVQGTGEPFLRFAERLTASVERQVDDSAARTLLVKTLAKNNGNAECRRIIEALLGDPSLLQMAEACVRMGTTGCKVAAMATTLWPTWKGQQGGKQTQANAQAGKKQGKKVKKGITPLFLCGRCARPNHMAYVCKAMIHMNGHPLSGSGNGQWGAKRKTKSRWREGSCSEATELPQVHWTVALIRDCPEMVFGADVAILSFAVWHLEWTLFQDAFVSLRDLVQELLDQDHLEPSTSSWDAPVFCIETKLWEMEVVIRPPKGRSSL
ncbi:hypothetical protein HGM15179_021219 [Zosterops borbonicus]|uniref:Retroviral nucleocapsid Gag protein p24 C-terminal domain-containing protein n=1 Tax=Zosterops borbonicus TaxID=364589 RepID=A0A8K1FX71_9PASS|nr:hypothetical protein HGM15179_021932 [Zosterops borbonicus]TRZ05890.1 hypothetical protein HGM15179_021219 [Zosterops borbonicus]